jgi:hypothetical protein
MKFHASSIALSLGLMAGAAQAAPGNYEIIQTQTFSDSLSTFNPAGGTYSPNTPRIMTVNPFSSYNTGSGTLNSVTIRWNTNWSFSGTTGAVGGSANLNNGGGNSYVGSISYGGNGGGSGGGAGPNSPFSFSATWAGTTPADYVFALPYQGGYNPAIATIFTGSSPFTVAYGYGSGAAGGLGGLGELAYSGIASGLATVSSDVTVKYSYFGEQVPAAVPVPATVALLGLGLVGIGAARRKQA